MTPSFFRFVYYTGMLLIIPCLLVISWVNLYIGKMQYDLVHYLQVFVLPSIVLAYIIGSFLYFFVGKYVHYTAQKIFFTLFGLLTVFLLIRYGVEFFGLHPLFITLTVTKKNAVEYAVANQYYSISIPFTLTLIFILYLLSGFIVEKK